MTSYQGNGSSIAATTVTTCNKLAPATGGTETSNLTGLVSGTTGWVQLFSQGSPSNQTGAGSEPTITDSNNNGWMTDDATFDGQTFSAGNWTPSITLNRNLATGSFIADIHCLLLKRPNGGGAYTIIGDIVLTSQAITTTKTTFSLPATSEGLAAFATGDRFCKVWLLNITTNSAGVILNITVYMSTSASTGVSGDTQIVSPGFSPTGGGAKSRIVQGDSLAFAELPGSVF